MNCLNEKTQAVLQLKI